jgi:hypothetical protein
MRGRDKAARRLPTLDSRRGHWCPHGVTDTAFDSVVFSGGGTRCFWQLGFLDAAAAPLSLSPVRLIAVSSGVLAACAWSAGRSETLLDQMKAVFAPQRHNVGHANGHDDQAATPHQELYSDVVDAVFDDAARRAVADGPALTVNLTVPPPLPPPLLEHGTALLAYELDQKIRSHPHTRLPSLLGAKPLAVDACAAARSQTLKDLICAAAAIPPVFDLRHWEGRPVMDGGMTDNAPLPGGHGRTLVLLTRRYRKTLSSPDIVVVSPSHEVPADKADFTDSDQLEKTWALGRRDGVRFVEARRG